MKRRVREGFRTEVTAQNSSALDTVWKKAKSEFEVVKRQSVVYSLYAREHKSVMVSLVVKGMLQYRGLGNEMGRVYFIGNFSNSSNYCCSKHPQAI